MATGPSIGSGRVKGNSKGKLPPPGSVLADKETRPSGMPAAKQQSVSTGPFIRKGKKTNP